MTEPVKHFYCHIPFCPKKCGYCAFVTHVGSLRHVPRYLEALEREFKLLAARRPGGPLSTVYFGGGTPSMLAPREIDRLLRALAARFGIEKNAEITLEAHPDTVDEARLRGVREAGVTRLSLGAESLQADELTALGRTHSPERVATVVRWVRLAGFSNLALDVMYGLPGQSLQSWGGTLQAVLALEPDHLSLYPLAIEPRTVFARRQREGRLTVPGDSTVARMYEEACAVLAERGYEHYEVANWSLPGRACRHNLAYWRNREFYGAGTGAHGYLGGKRYENVRQTSRYIDAMLAGSDPVAEVESIDAATRVTETIMLRLRLLHEGLDYARLQTETGIVLRARHGEVIDRLEAAGLVRLTGERLTLTATRALLAHEAIAELM